MKQRTLIVIVVAALVVLGGVALAKDTGADGQDLYKEYCKPCHLEDSDNGEYTPMTLIQEQWERFFDEKYVESHQSVADPNHDNKPVTEVITPEMLQQIREFAIDHAADSEQPMTCG